MTWFRGVTPHAEGGFVVKIGHQGKQKYLGIFRTFDEAKQARLDAEMQLFGRHFDRREIEIIGQVANIPLHGQRGVFKGWALVDIADLDRVRGIAWTLDSRGYVVGRPPGFRNNMTMHRWLAPWFEIVDHRNRNRLDNRRENLRAATQAENSRNTDLSSNNTSGAKGVTPTPSGGWRARIWFNRKEIHIGTFETREDAQQAYDRKARELHGDFASPNVEIKTIAS